MTQPTTRERRTSPLVVVHTGDGKGKTSAAMGTALRTWAHGGSVGIYQFVKSAKWRTGELTAFRALGDSGQGGPVTVEVMGQGWSWSRAGQEGEPAERAAEGWAHIAAGLAEERHDLWVLDEMTYPLTWGWVDVDAVVAALTARPGRQHVIITGRACPQPVLDIADLVTEMTKVRHPFDTGQRGQAGIEW